MSHYGLKANGKRGRMRVVKDVQAVDNTVSQTITSSCREEAKQIGWHKRHAKGKQNPLAPSILLEIQSLMLTQPREPPSLLEGSRFAGQAGSNCGVLGAGD